MAVAVKKYNPGFLTDDEIIESFCVRTHEFESIVESLREMGSSSSTHSLVIGPPRQWEDTPAPACGCRGAT